MQEGYTRHDLAQAIRRSRGRRSQASLARASGLHAATWGLYEAAKREPRLETLSRIAQGLGCSIEDLETSAREVRRERLALELRRLQEQPQDNSSAFHALLRELAHPELQGRDLWRQQLRSVLQRLALEVEELVVLLRSDAASPPK